MNRRLMHWLRLINCTTWSAIIGEISINNHPPERSRGAACSSKRAIVSVPVGPLTSAPLGSKFLTLVGKASYSAG